MVYTLQPTLSINSCAVSTQRFLKKQQRVCKRNTHLFTVRASAEEADDCNEEECAPEKEVGLVSMEWVAGDRTKVVGTFPPRTRGWTGYVEKDTAGQTNIYSVEPAVYVAESAISSGSAGSSSDGSENTAAVAAGLGLIAVAAASLILLQVGKNRPPQVPTVDYSGPSLSYYISKFKPEDIVQSSAPIDAESAPAPQPEESTPEASEFQVESQVQLESSTESNVS